LPKEPGAGLPNDNEFSLKRGLYEELITESLESDLLKESPTLTAIRNDLKRPEAGDRLALHLSRIIQTAVDGLDEALSRVLWESKMA